MQMYVRKPKCITYAIPKSWEKSNGPFAYFVTYGTVNSTTVAFSDLWLLFCLIRLRIVQFPEPRRLETTQTHLAHHRLNAIDSKQSKCAIKSGINVYHGVYLGNKC